MAKATTVRFSDEIFARLDQASSRTGMPVNSIVVAACLEWMDRHTPWQGSLAVPAPNLSVLATAPRWATLRRAVIEAVAGRTAATSRYPFEGFTEAAQQMLTTAQSEGTKTGLSYIGTEHLLLAGLADPNSHAGQALATLGITEPAVREALANKEIHGWPPPKHMLLPTSRVKAVIKLAFETCSQASETKVSTGHILIALAAEGDGIAARILQDAGATPEAIARALPAQPEA
jgi:ATP-dependent Clp protease ATP-binding subunit ClpC